MNIFQIKHFYVHIFGIVLCFFVIFYIFAKYEVFRNAVTYINFLKSIKIEIIFHILVLIQVVHQIDKVT